MYIYYLHGYEITSEDLATFNLRTQGQEPLEFHGTLAEAIQYARQHSAGATLPEQDHPSCC